MEEYGAIQSDNGMVTELLRTYRLKQLSQKQLQFD